MLRNPYANIQIGGRGIIHAVSALSLSSAFLFIYYRLAYLYPLVRMIITGCFTVLSIHLYDFVWSVAKYVQLGYGARVVPLVIICCIIALLEAFHNKHGILHCTETGTQRVISYTMIFILAFGAMMYNDFYKALEVHEEMGTDPNAGHTEWAIGKIIVFWLAVPLIKKSSHKAPLRLDPRVLIWQDRNSC